MLSLKIAGSLVELPPDFSVTMNFKSPIFNDTGSFSYPFNLPNSPRNAIQFGFRHRVAGTGSVYQEFDASCLWKGSPFFTGTAKLRVLNSNIFEGYILEGAGDFNYQVKNLNLRQIDFGEFAFASDLEAMLFINNGINKYYPDRPMCFPQIFNEFYLDPATEDFDQKFLNRHLNGVININTPAGNKNLIVPMLYVRYVLQCIFSQVGYTFDDCLFTSHPDYNKLVLFNSLSANSIMTDFSYSIQHIYLNLHVPSVSLADFLKAISSFWNSSFFINTEKKTVKLIPTDSILLDDTCMEFSRKIVSMSIEPEDQVMGFSFKQELDGDDKVFNEETANEDANLKMRKGAVNNIDELPQFPIAEIGESRFVIDLNEYRWMSPLKTWMIGGGSEQFIFSRFSLKQPKDEISIGLSSLLSEGFNELACSCGNSFSAYKDIKPRIFFAGYNNIDEPHYMFARNRTSAFGLFYNQPNNPYIKYWKNYADFKMSTKLVKIVKQMEFSELKDFDFSKKYMINGIKYLVKDIQVVLKRDRIMPAILECYTCS
ncbi:MAG: hypothetical protein WCR01_11315 [Bacteroidota bacterium]